MPAGRSMPGAASRSRRGHADLRYGARSRHRGIRRRAIEESRLRIGIGNHVAGEDSLATCQLYARGTILAHDDAVHNRAGADRRPRPRAPPAPARMPTPHPGRRTGCASTSPHAERGTAASTPAGRARTDWCQARHRRRGALEQRQTRNVRPAGLHAHAADAQSSRMSARPTDRMANPGAARCDPARSRSPNAGAAVLEHGCRARPPSQARAKGRQRRGVGAASAPASAVGPARRRTVGTPRPSQWSAYVAASIVRPWQPRLSSRISDPASGAAGGRRPKPGSPARIRADRRAADLARPPPAPAPAAATREIGGADQAVVAAADDDAVVAVSPACAALSEARPRSRRISPAALAPGAPITPPPGWVLEPHMYIPASARGTARIRGSGG